VPKKEKR